MSRLRSATVRSRRLPPILALLGCGLLLAAPGCLLPNFDDSVVLSTYPLKRVGETATRQEHGSISERATRIVIENRFGPVTVEAADASYGWNWEATAHADGVEQAKQLLDQIYVAEDRDGDTWTWRIVLPEEAPPELNGLESKLVARVPADAYVEVDNLHGMVSVRATDGGARITCAQGAVRLEDVGGFCRVISRHAPITALRIENALFESAHGAVSCKDVAGSLEASASFATVAIDNVAGDLEVRAENCALSASRVRGGCRLSTSFGALKLESAGGAVHLENRHGSIDARGVQSKLVVRGSFGEIRIEGSPTDVDCRADFSPMDLVLANRLLLRVYAQSSYAPLTVQLPAEEKRLILAYTDGAKPNSELPVQVLRLGTSRPAHSDAAPLLFIVDHGELNILKLGTKPPQPEPKPLH